MEDGSKSQNERRRAPRVAPARIAIEFDDIDDRCRMGLIHDLSSTGIRVETSGVPPPVQAHAHLTFVFGNEIFELGARIVRHTESGGFALEFDAPDSRLQQRIADEIYAIAWTEAQKGPSAGGPPSSHTIEHALLGCSCRPSEILQCVVCGRRLASDREAIHTCRPHCEQLLQRLQRMGRGRSTPSSVGKNSTDGED
jgi:hypothetical protein